MLRRLRIPCALAALLLPGCRAPELVQRPPVEEIVAANRLLEERFSSGDLLGVADLYADDAVLFAPGGQRVHGRAEIDAYWTSVVDPVSWELDIRSVEGSQDLVFERGTSRLTARHDGVPQTTEVEFAFLWRRQADGSWKIALDAFWVR